ncbi:MAG: nitrate- and nitrite sensing domain-containing protein [Gammaproteobacteria bacterium]|nr:nitrate- and nitrite sensing domain-containing protein [Gammaproteobacteria bacterium]MCP5423606.1 nitrate- and nitrite sensing domain-containing protein [Gammaproteobacteria bacterium]
MNHENTTDRDPAPSSVSDVVLLAKRLEIDELKRLQSRAHLVGVLSHMVHALQAERGASSIFIASRGQRFDATRLKLVSESDSVQHLLRDLILEESRRSSSANAKIVALLAWVLLGLDALSDLRARVANLGLSGGESVAAYSRLIAGLIALIFEVADASVDPAISRLLVSLFNLVEGKEFAGQERAVGALHFGSGRCDGPLKERLLHLLDAQERSFGIFLKFADSAQQRKWDAMASQDFTAEQERLRELLRAAQPGAPLDPALSDMWFECCSSRITAIWSIQRDLVEALHQGCAALIAQAEGALLDSEGLLRSLREAQPARANTVYRFFDPQFPVEQSLSFAAASRESSAQPRSLIELLQAQSRHLADMEAELASAKRALAERKVIERAKGMIMARHSLSEDEAYALMRKVSMNQNMRLADVAETLLTEAVGS